MADRHPQAITSFLGGEISPYAQGRFDRPDYKFSLNVCLNSFPVEIGAWVRRPGTQHGMTTRGGNKGRSMEFDFEQSTPITMEFTDGWMRFSPTGPLLLTTNDAQTVSAISTANPAVVNTAAANTWATGNTVMFPSARRSLAGEPPVHDHPDRYHALLFAGCLDRREHRWLDAWRNSRVDRFARAGIADRVRRGVRRWAVSVHAIWCRPRPPPSCSMAEFPRRL